MRVSHLGGATAKIGLGAHYGQQVDNKVIKRGRQEKMSETIRELHRSKVWDYENGFYWFSPKSRINKLLAHYELYKTIVGIPGHIFELGVYKGASLVRFATFRNVLENDDSRRIIGFDTFSSFPLDKLELDEDLEFVQRFKEAGGDALSEGEISSVLNSKGFENISLVKGNVFDTLPEFLSLNPEVRIAMLHLDMDTKEPTDFALESLYERVVPGGLIVFDDYNAVAGETKSVDEFIKARSLRIEKLPFYNVPSYIRKPVKQI